MKSKNPYGGPARGLPEAGSDGVPGPCTHGTPKGFEAGSAYAPPRVPATTPSLIYMVTATFSDASLKDEYLTWLTDGHVQAVIAGGAREGSVEVLDGGEDTPLRIRSRYVFADEAAFAHYETEVAPALRADGVGRFGGERGVTYSRETARIFWRG